MLILVILEFVNILYPKWGCFISDNFSLEPKALLERYVCLPVLLPVRVHSQLRHPFQSPPDLIVTLFI